MASLKKQVAAEMAALEREIQYLEIKRSRSIAALLESYVSQTRPNDDDVAFFRAFTQEIEAKRQQLQELTQDYENL